jgi:ABC-2 type transport system permease protein
MHTILLFDLKTYSRSYISYLILVLLTALGIFCGQRFNLSTGEGILLNGPYTIGFMTGMLSLAIIFIATVFSGQLLFKEWDNKFATILFTTPLTKKQFTAGRFFAFFLLTFICFLFLITGFAWGQYLRNPVPVNVRVIAYYLYPLFLFGFINTLFTCSVLYCIAVLTRRKLLVITGGLLLYIFYMVVLLFSNAPFMAGSMPQSLSAQQLSALADPFGLSAYFYAAKDYTVIQRNTQLVTPTAYLLFNRLLFTLLSLLLLYTGYRFFSFSANKKNKHKKNSNPAIPVTPFTMAAFPKTNPVIGHRAGFNALLSFAQKDLVYIFKSIALVVIALLLLFAVGMEMYAEIEKGIRLPQLYARSGLMASTIIENFHFIGLLIMVYVANDLFWRSKACGFSLIENSTYFARKKLAGHWLSCSILLFFFTVLLVVLGLVFQWGYGYFHIDWSAYAGVFVFNTFPLILFAGAVLLLNQLIRNKYIALAVSLLLAILTIGPIAQKLILHPLFRFFSTQSVAYSDFSGYSIYLPSFLLRGLFGAAVILLLWQLLKGFTVTAFKSVASWTSVIILCITGYFAAQRFSAHYQKVPVQQQVEQAVAYEKKFRQFQTLPQPVITKVTTTIELYPGKESYTIHGRYILKNISDTPVQQVLVNFHPDLAVEQAIYQQGDQRIALKEKVTAIVLSKPLTAGDTATLDFSLTYQWYAVNGHASLNAIMEDGSFMRISRYYPQFGYQANYELSNEKDRKQYALGTATSEKKLEDPRTYHSFIELDMTIGTTLHQAAIGTGELVAQWEDKQRRYFQYRPAMHVPFRFAIASAAYAVRTDSFEQIPIRIFYQPLHHENVQALMNNIKATLAYCQANFGPYPFRSLSFAEVSSFTKGFAATAYPGVIFMTENLVFQANIRADRQQDVINELAGHEIAHFWWGTQSITPDDREGAAMLTESLAMYTEMMVYKKVHGAAKMKERLQVHQQIYDATKGFSTPQALYKVSADNTPVSYSKGALVMVQLSELIGEDKVNAALRRFLQAHQYPQPAPVSTDLIEAFLQVSDAAQHKAIKGLFETP